MRVLAIGLILGVAACNTPFEPVALPSQSDIPVDAEQAQAPLAAPMGVELFTAPSSEQSLYVSLEEADLDPDASTAVAQDDILAVAGGALAELDAQQDNGAQPLVELAPDQAAIAPAAPTEATANPPVPAQNNECPEGAPYLYKGTLYCGNFLGN